jgi:hypothetical protein
MPPFSDLSNEQILTRMLSQPAHVQAVMGAELARREAERNEKQSAELREAIDSVRSELGSVKTQLETLKESHRIHKWILVVAIVTAAFALIAALDPVLKWLKA